jgi:hypothetical protein
VIDGAWLNKLRRTQPSTAHITGVTGSGVFGGGARNGLRRLVTMPLRNPTRPIAGVAISAVGATGAVAAATVWLVDALFEVLTVTACAVGTAVDSVSDADGFATVATTFSAPMEAAGVVVFPVAECAESDSVLAGVDVACSGSGLVGAVLGEDSPVSPEAGSLDSGWVSTPLGSSSNSEPAVVGAVDASGSVALVCAPPLLLIVTSDPTWVDEDVVPDVAVSVVVVVPVPVDVAPPLVDVVSVPADPLDVEPAELVEDGSEDAPVVSAPANP